MISGVVLTFNEENILAKCLDALSFVDHLLVFDSFSTDRTLSIAKSYQAQIECREFDNYASQRNAALRCVPENCDWVIMVDSDEIVTHELRDEILEQITMDSGVTMFRVRRKDMFQNKWIKQSSGYPTWFPRVFKNGYVEVAREINEEYITSGNEGYLQEHLIHYPFNKGLSWWFEKHNRYSQMEAIAISKEMQEPLKLFLLFSKNPVVRRKSQKRLSYYLPFRPKFVFFAFFILKGGFLNGRAGYTFCKLRQTYEWMIAIKLDELNSRHKY